MKSERSASLPIGLALGTGLGAFFGNPTPGALLGMLSGLIISTGGRTQDY